MQRISLREQFHVSGGELARKARCRSAIALGEVLPLEAATHQPPELGSRVAGGARQIEHQHTLVGFAKLWISKAPEHCGNEAVALNVVADGLEFDFNGPCQKGAQLRHRLEPSFVHIDHHVVDDRPNTHASGSYLVGNTNPRSGSYHIGIDLGCTSIQYRRIITMRSEEHTS